MTSLPSFTAAAPAATATAPSATPTVLRTLPKPSNLLPDSSAALPPSLMAFSFSSSSRFMSLSAASALLSWICQFWVRRSFSPNDSAALARAERSVSIFRFCWSISLFSTWFLAVRASADLSFLSNCESTSFISEPRTLNELLISARDFLNSRSPSRPIFRPKFSDILRHLLGNGIKKEPCGSEILEKERPSGCS